MSSRVAYLCTDLLFTSKIRETATALGQAATLARDPSSLVEVARGATLVIVDLRLPSALAAIARLREDERLRSVAAAPIVGFCDHQRVDLMESAREAGCTTVLAKGKFSSELSRLLAGSAATATPVSAQATSASDSPAT